MTTAPPTADHVMGLMSGVIDPELGSDIVELGMAKSADVSDDGVITLEIALTTSGCPLRAQIQKDIRSRLTNLPGVTRVKINWGELSQDERAEAMAKARFNVSQNAPDTSIPSTTKVIMVASGKGARSGVLFRNAEAIEALCGVDTLVLDKTGTLTEGRPALTRIEPLAAVGEEELLRLAASLERGSEHPIAAAITSAAEERAIAFGEVKGFQSFTGEGVAGDVDGLRVMVGNVGLLSSQGVAGADLDGFQERVFEAAVKVDDERARGLGFVDGVLRGGGVSDAACTVQLRSARSVLESRLERIENPSDKGRKLLVQALEVDPTHEEAKIYLAF